MVNNEQARKAREEKEKKERNRVDQDPYMVKIKEDDEYNSPQVQSNGMLPPVNLP